jgi:hypothetical protein
VKDDAWLMKWIYDLKEKIDNQILSYGGMENLDEKLTQCQDPEILIFQKILTECLDIVKFTTSALCSIAMPLLSIHLVLIHGLTDNIPISISVGGWYLSSFFKDPKGFNWTLLTENLTKKSRVSFPYNNSLFEFGISTGYQFGGTVKEMLFHMEEAIKWGISYSEFIFGTYSVGHYTMIQCINGNHLPSVLRKVKKYHEVI